MGMTLRNVTNISTMLGNALALLLDDNAHVRGSILEALRLVNDHVPSIPEDVRCPICHGVQTGFNVKLFRGRTTCCYSPGETLPTGTLTHEYADERGRR